jgi:hypothetical protein
MYCILYAKDITPRLSYIAKFIFEELLDSELTVTNKDKQYIASPLVKIHYGTSRLVMDELLIPSHTLLFEKKISPQPIEVSEYSGLPAFFQMPSVTDADFDCDFLAMAFYLMTRYEEYLPFTPDQYGRFSAAQSLAMRADFLHLPLVQLWVIKLRDKLLKKFPEALLSLPTYQYQPTFDIDEVFKYKHRGVERTIRNIGGEIVRGQIQSLRSRLKTITNKTQTDPFDVFDYIKELHTKCALQPIFFFLVGDFGKNDTNLPHDNEAVQTIIKQLGELYTVGIHPSYRSNTDSKRIDMEKRRLEAIVLRQITSTRQHFLKLSFPKTYKHLLANQLTTDYSMGYADAIGFRASVAVPFYWYDLKKNTPTRLKIIPFQAMDVTLRQANYLNLSPEEAVKRVIALAQITKEVGGTFITLWHNSSFDTTNGWVGWKEAYEKIVEGCK